MDTEYNSYGSLGTANSCEKNHNLCLQMQASFLSELGDTRKGKETFLKLSSLLYWDEDFNCYNLPDSSWHLLSALSTTFCVANFPNMVTAS
jgi:hypothetical protein